ncbi:hypothetical protein Hypma_003942 [Hypsizygus marmoreus]|uniref:Uncharacterized protein n=1 Tax=Hypsizygus marmoreus TaxID=39966 RepID=A0A369J3J9_HYPMA|nr:hypothetical protein Hypma_003942 [Hypsizygus marmoreus]
MASIFVVRGPTSTVETEERDDDESGEPEHGHGIPNPTPFSPHPPNLTSRGGTMNERKAERSQCISTARAKIS